MAFNKTFDRVNTGLNAAVATPIKQATLIAIFAAIMAGLALLIASTGARRGA